jgi:hypothetical protein
MIPQFRAIAAMVGEVGPRLEALEQLGENAVFIETVPLLIKGQVQAKILGPYSSPDEADNYIRIKMERHAKYYEKRDKAGVSDKINSDKDLYGHPDFAYRTISAAGYCAKYMAQVMVECLGGLVGAVVKKDDAAPFYVPDGGPGILDEDDADEDER